MFVPIVEGVSSGYAQRDLPILSFYQQHQPPSPSLDFHPVSQLNYLDHDSNRVDHNLRRRKHANPLLTWRSNVNPVAVTHGPFSNPRNSTCRSGLITAHHFANRWPRPRPLRTPSAVCTPRTSQRVHNQSIIELVGHLNCSLACLLACRPHAG